MRVGGVAIKRPLNAPDLLKVTWTAPKTTLPTDPCDPSYQDEYRAAQRFETVRHELRVLLEAGTVEVAIWDRATGQLHRVPVPTWRQDGAERMIKSGRAQIPPYGDIGPLLVKASVPTRMRSVPLPHAKFEEAIAALKEKTATESLTRPQQAEFVRRVFPEHHVTARQLQEIFRLVPLRLGRPRKSNKKV